MMRNPEQMEALVNEVHRHIDAKLFLENRMGGLEAYLEKIGFIQAPCNCFPEVDHNPLILIIGDLSCKEKDVIGIFKQLGLDPESIIFLPYDKVANFNFGRLKCNSRFSDILCGPLPHSASGMEGYSSILAKLEQAPQNYPRAIRLVDVAGRLKITKESLKQGLMKTRLYELMQQRSLKPAS